MSQAQHAQMGIREPIKDDVLFYTTGEQSWGKVRTIVADFRKARDRVESI
jgi:hypothetical protein